MIKILVQIIIYEFHLIPYAGKIWLLGNELYFRHSLSPDPFTRFRFFALSINIC